MAALAVLRITYSLRSSASCTITSVPRPMNTWRRMGSFLRTVGDMGMSRVHRHIAPAQQHLAFGLDGALHLLLAGQAGGVLLGQEDHAHAVLAGGRQLHALLGHFFAVELIGNLDQDAGAIAHQRVGTHRATVVDVFQNLQRACVTMSWRFTPLMWATKPRPQASCSLPYEYKPCCCRCWISAAVVMAHSLISIAGMPRLGQCNMSCKNFN